LALLENGYGERFDSELAAHIRVGVFLLWHPGLMPSTNEISINAV
jgi:hypothetical protein